MKKGAIIIKQVILIWSLSGTLAAQDFHLSQYDAAPMYLNPAMTGNFNGHYRVHAHYRTQWNAIATKPFVTPAISFDMPIKKFAWGIQIMNNRAGAGNFNVMSGLAAISYDFAIDKNNNHHVSIGVQGGVLQKSVNVSLLTFDDQYTYDNGGGFNNPTSEVVPNQSMILPDVNAGLMYYYSKPPLPLDIVFKEDVFTS